MAFQEMPGWFVLVGLEAASRSKDRAALGEATSSGQQFPQSGVVVKGDLLSRPAVQISRKANRRDGSSALETPLVKLLKVLRWILSR